MSEQARVPDEFELLAELAQDLGIRTGRHEDVTRVGVDVDGVTVTGLRWGTGPVEAVFLHGGSQNAHTWDALLLRLSMSALALDLPGHGRSSWFEHPSYLPRQLAPVVGAAIDSLAPAAGMVVGMSLGGMTALRLATTRPDLVRRLVLVDVSPASTPDRSREITDFVEVAEFESFSDLVDHTAAFRPHVPRRAVRRSVLYNARQRADGRWTWRHDRREPPGGGRMAKVFADLPSYWDDVAGLRCPALLVVGGRSPIVTRADVARYRELAPSVEIVEVPGAGHNVQGDAPEALAEVIVSFSRPVAG